MDAGLNHAKHFMITKGLYLNLCIFNLWTTNANSSLYGFCVLYMTHIILIIYRIKLPPPQKKKHFIKYCVGFSCHTIFFSYTDKAARLKDCDRGEDNILSDGSRPSRPVIELETRRASINKPRPWSSGHSSISAEGRT